MRALEEQGLPKHKVEMQQEGRERLRRSFEKNREVDYDRQLQRMEGWGVHLPTSPELRFMIKLQPILKPVNEPEKHKNYIVVLGIKKPTNLKVIKTPEPSKRH